MNIKYRNLRINKSDYNNDRIALCQFRNNNNAECMYVHPERHVRHADAYVSYNMHEETFSLELVEGHSKQSHRQCYVTSRVQLTIHRNRFTK